MIPGLTGSETVNEYVSSVDMQTVAVNQTDDPGSLFDASQEKPQGTERVTASNQIT